MRFFGRLLWDNMILCNICSLSLLFNTPVILREDFFIVSALKKLVVFWYLFCRVYISVALAGVATTPITISNSYMKTSYQTNYLTFTWVDVFLLKIDSPVNLHKKSFPRIPSLDCSSARTACCWFSCILPEIVHLLHAELLGVDSPVLHLDAVVT